MKIINKIKLTASGLVVTGTKRKIHLRQGDMDGACAVYSMMMCLIMIKAITPNDVHPDNEHPNGRESKGRLINHFLNYQGMIRTGYELDKLKEELEHVFKSKVQVIYKDEDVLSNILLAIDKDIPVEIGIDYKRKGGHAIAVIGYKVEKDSTLLFCLDPAFPLQEGTYWNNVLIVKGQKAEGYNCYDIMEDNNVRICDMLTYSKP